MKKAIIGKKVGMTQIFDADGHIIPVTVIEAGPCVVVQKKTVEKDGYDSVQLGFTDMPERLVIKPQKGHFEKAGAAVKRYLKEFKLENSGELNVGDVLKADVFSEGDLVDVVGVSNGKGLRRRREALEREHAAAFPRRRTRSQGRRFHGREYRSVEGYARKENAGPYGRRAGNHPELKHRQG